MAFLVISRKYVPLYVSLPLREEYNCVTQGFRPCSSLHLGVEGQTFQGNGLRAVKVIDNHIGDSRRTVEADALGESGANPEQGPLL